jgi:hypothetical protein
LNKVGKIDPACRPPRSQRIPHKPGKVVVQMVVYLPSSLAHNLVFAGTLKAGSEDTLSVSSCLAWVRQEWNSSTRPDFTW